MGKNEILDLPIQCEKGIVWGVDETVYSADAMIFAKGSHGYIKNDIDDIKSNYIKLGFHLKECQGAKYYECFGYSNFYDYVHANFGLDKSAVNRCMNVFNRFCQKQGASYQMRLDDKWKDYSYSQLTEMLPLDDESIKDITPDMTVKQIREYKRQVKNSGKKVAMSQPIEVEERTEGQKVIDFYTDMYCYFMLAEHAKHNRRMGFRPMSRLVVHESYGKQFLSLA